MADSAAKRQERTENGTEMTSAATVRPYEGLREFREKLNDLHHEIQNRDDSPEAFEVMLWLAIDYLLPDFDPRYEVDLRSRRFRGDTRSGEGEP